MGRPALKRRSRFGSINQLASKRWRARYQTADKGWVTHSFDTHEEAEAWLDNIKNDRNKGLSVGSSKLRMTIGQIAAEWEQSVGGVKVGTEVENRRILNSSILPRFKDLPASAVDALMVRKWMKEMEKAGAAPGTRKNHKNVLSLIMQMAIEMGCRLDNPCRAVKVVRSTDKEEMTFLTHEDVHRLAEAHPAPFNLAVRLSAYCGLRAGEIWALRVKALNLTDRRLAVVMNVRWVSGHGLVEAMPKSWQRRSVVVPRELMADLANLCIGKGPDDLVFESPEGEQVNHSNFKKRQWETALDVAGIGTPRFHDLRHTCAAFYFARGATGEVVRRVLGHGSISETHRTYAHIFPKAFEELIEGIDDDIAESLKSLLTTPDTIEGLEEMSEETA